MKAIPNHAGYFADESGDIYSMRPHGGNCGNGAKPPTEPRELKVGLMTGGYRGVNLCNGSGKSQLKKVSVLILETFAGPRPTDMQACHNNGIRTDDRLINLRWDTCKNNMSDKILHGTNIVARGELNGLHKLNEMQARVIRRCVEFRMKQKEVAAIFGVDQAAVCRISHRESWQHV